MNLFTCLATLLLVGAVLAWPMPADAGPGHDHGHDHGEAAAGAAPALPRFAAVSETFELVGVLDGRQITLYLDRTADNTPVTAARIELEVAGAKFQAQPHEDAYRVELAAAPQPGVLPITATVTAGAEVDLLAGELDLHADAPAEPPAHAHSWKEYAGWAAAGLAGLVMLVWTGRRVIAGRRADPGAVA